MDEFLKPLAKKRKLQADGSALGASSTTDSTNADVSDSTTLQREMLAHYAHDDMERKQARQLRDDQDAALEALPETERLLKLMDQVEDEDVAIDVKAVRRLIKQLDVTHRKNEELRVKFPDQPTRFVDSETDLDEAINDLTRLAAAPQHYGELTPLAPRLVALLAHENSDIAVDTVRLIRELTDEDVLPEDVADQEAAVAGMRKFVEALVKQHVVEALVESLARLDEEKEEEERGVFAVLGIVENFISVDPALADTITKTTTLLPWLLTRVSVKPYHANKQYASEILAILLQSSPLNHGRLAEADGVDTLLGALAAYKRRDPKDDDEQELMENLFDCLCSALASTDVKEKFVEGEGVELAILMLKEKRLARMRALKLLAFAMAGLSRIGAQECCERFVDAQGLKYLFSALMKKFSRQLKKDYPKSFSDSEEDEHTMTILSALFRHLTEEAPHFRLQRLSAKFAENGAEKASRLCDIHDQYWLRVARAEKKARGDEDEAELYFARLDHGLSTLQMVDLALAHLLTADDDEADSVTSGNINSIRECVSKKFQERGRSIAEIQSILGEYLMNVGNADEDVGITDREKMRVTQFMDLLEGVKEATHVMAEND